MSSITDALANKNRQPAIEPDPTPPAPAEKAKRDGTEYVVLEQSDESNDGWFVIEHVTGVSSASAAIQKALDNVAEPDSGCFVAVPARSWKPVTVRVQQVSRVKLEQA